MDKVQELLDTARAFCNLAERETNRDAGRLEKAAQYAAIAQAHAATAQAMVLHLSTLPMSKGGVDIGVYSG